MKRTLRTCSILAWVIFLVIGFVGGTVRALVLEGPFGRVPAEWIESALVISLFILLIRRFINEHYTELTATRAVGLGTLWAGLTMAFEFLFFHYVTGHSWEELLANYRIDQGRVWVVVILSLWITPWIVYRNIRSSKENGKRSS